MELINGLLSAFGLSASAGLNAYIPLMVVGLLDRFTDLIDLSSPYDLISHPATLITLGVLILIELLADNVPVINHINDAIQTFIRPTAGAIAFAAATDGVDVAPVLALISGLLVAGGVHATKSLVVRPAVNVATAGVGNTPVSLTEDAVAYTMSITAVALPILILVVGGAVAYFVIRLVGRSRDPAEDSGRRDSALPPEGGSPA